jgi:hypothetical protein
MAEFNVRSDSVNVEQIMEQIRARIREKRGVDYTEAEIQQLAGARLETFIDPGKLHSNLLAEFHRVRIEGDAPEALEAAVDESVLFETHRGWLRALRKLLRPVLKLFLNTKALAALTARSKAELKRKSRDQMTFELIHNMVVEMTRLGIEVKNLTMRVESMQSRLEFNERRARALEGAVVYKPSEPDDTPQRPPVRESRPPFRDSRESRDSRPPAEFRPRQESPQPSSSAPSPAPGGAPAQGSPEGQGQPGQGQRRRRRRRRGRRGGGQPWTPNQPGQPNPNAPGGIPESTAPADESTLPDAHVDGPHDEGPDEGPDEPDTGGGEPDTP